MVSFPPRALPLDFSSLRAPRMNLALRSGSWRPPVSTSASREIGLSSSDTVRPSQMAQPTGTSASRPKNGTMEPIGRASPGLGRLIPQSSEDGGSHMPSHTKGASRTKTCQVPTSATTKNKQQHCRTRKGDHGLVAIVPQSRPSRHRPLLSCPTTRYLTAYRLLNQRNMDPCRRLATPLGMRRF